MSRSGALLSASSRRALFAKGPKAWPGAANIQAAFDLRRPPTLAATTRGKTATVPTLTSSTDLKQLVPFWTQNSIAGIQGVAAGVLSLDGGRTEIFNGVWPPTLALPGTPLSLNFGAGTFGINDNYQPAIAEWTDYVNGHVMTSLNLSSSPVLEVKGAHDPSHQDIFQRNMNGAMRQHTAAAEACMMLNSTLGANVFSGNGNNSWTVMVCGVLRASLTSGSEAAFIGGGSSLNSATQLLTLGHNGGGAWRTSLTNDAGTNTIIDVGATNHSLNHLTWRYDGTNHLYTTRHNGVELDKRSLNIGNWTLGSVQLLARRRRSGGTPIDSSFLNGTETYALFWNSALSDSDCAFIESLLQEFYRWGNIFTDVNAVFVGDSQSDPARIITWPRQVLFENDSQTSGTENSPQVNNLAVAGNSVLQQITAPFQAQLAAAFVPGMRNILTIELGQNDIDPDASGDVNTLITNYGTLLGQAAAAGFTNIINVTMPLAGIPVLPLYVAKQTTFNNYLYSVTDPRKILNFNNLPGVPGDGINWAAGDTRHLTRQGYAFISDLFQPCYRFAMHGQS